MSFTSPPLPHPRGPVSEALFDYLRLCTSAPPSLSELWLGGDALADDDLQLALYSCYE